VGLGGEGGALGGDGSKGVKGMAGGCLLRKKGGFKKNSTKFVWALFTRSENLESEDFMFHRGGNWVVDKYMGKGRKSNGGEKIGSTLKGKVNIESQLKRDVHLFKAKQKD